MTTRTISSSSVSVSQRIAIGAACFLVGAVLVFGTGFAQSDTMHNAAHDTRHSIGFPCH